MISTIGSLVQETTSRLRWLLATGLYISGCIGTSLIVGTVLGWLGHFLPLTSVHGVNVLAQSLVGILAIGCALSDMNFMCLPRPYIRQVAANATKGHSSRFTAEGARDLLLNFDHPKIPLREMVVKRHDETVQEGQHGLPVVDQSVKQIVGRTLFGTTLGAGGPAP